MASHEHDSSAYKPSTEIDEDANLEGTTSDGTSQYGPRPTEEVRIDVSSNNMQNEKGYQDIRNTTREVHTDTSSKDIATDKASQDVHEEPEEGSSEGMATDEPAEDGPKTIREDKKGSSKDMPTTEDDMWLWMEEKERRSKNEVNAVLLEAVVDENCRRLFKAALKGDWKTIEKILTQDPAKVTATVITADGGQHFSVLDVAIMAGRDQLVEKLVNRFPPEHELLVTRVRRAAKRGSIKMVSLLVAKIIDNPKTKEQALLNAVSAAPPKEKELIWYLARRAAASTNIMDEFIIAGHMDIAFYFARKRYDRPGSVKDDLKGTHINSLDLLAVLPSYFRSGARLNFWEKFIYKCIPLCLVDTTFDDSKDNKMAPVLRALNWIKTSLWNFATVPFIKRIGELKLRHNCSLEFAKLLFDKMKDEMTTPEILEYLLTSGAVLDAASHGVLEIVDLCLKYFPELMWDIDFASKLTTRIVKERHVEMFRLVDTHNLARYLDIQLCRETFDLMKAVTEWPAAGESPDVSGAAFLMQRELQWFQVVDVGLIPPIKWMKFQEDRKSYWEFFVDKRKELLQDAREWMKDTSSSCSLVATLIITIAFAAAFTVPGGNNGSTGIPIFLKNGSFLVFAIADTLALLFSVSATLIFLAILTSRYAIEDFRHSLPRKIIFGLTFLFLSLVFMLVAFGSALAIVLKERLKWIYIPITLLATFPVVLFTILQLPLYIEMVNSTFWPRLSRPLKPWDDLDITQ